MRPNGLAIGRIVIYRSRTGDYDVPAIITATIDTLHPKGPERYAESDGKEGVPPLSSDEHVHLHVLTPGDQVQYQEHDVQFSEGAGSPGTGHPAQTWRWPSRV